MTGRPKLPLYMWQDDAGALHFDIPGFLAAHGYANTRANRDTAAEVLAELVRKRWPGVPIHDVGPER
jgi:hypothetical protein